MKLTALFILLIQGPIVFGVEDKICIAWFKSLNIVVPSGCESYCSIATTDLRTFVCKSKCSSLCSEFVPSNLSLAVLNPVLNKSEQALAKKFPLDSLMAYKLSFSAESLCGEIFHKSLSDDESDGVNKPNPKNWRKLNDFV